MGSAGPNRRVECVALDELTSSVEAARLADWARARADVLARREERNRAA